MKALRDSDNERARPWARRKDPGPAGDQHEKRLINLNDNLTSLLPRPNRATPRQGGYNYAEHHSDITPRRPPAARSRVAETKAAAHRAKRSSYPRVGSTRYQHRADNQNGYQPRRARTRVECFITLGTGGRMNVYHTGNLASDRRRDDSLHLKATDAMKRARAGRSHLVQRIAGRQLNAAGCEMRVFEYIEVPAREISNK